MHTRHSPLHIFCVILFLSMTGCRSTDQKQLKQKLMEYQSSVPSKRAEQHYMVRSPDVLEIRSPQTPEWSGTFSIEPDGKIYSGLGKSILVEGKTPAEIAKIIADLSSVSIAGIQVSVTSFNSQKLFVHGEIEGNSRAVPYRGPETVVSLLKRMGGVTKGAVASDIQVVRARIAEGEVPEIFHVDLKEVLLKGKHEEDPILYPFDQIYVLETKRSVFEKCLPRWCRPLYKKICGLGNPGDLISPRLPLGPLRAARFSARGR